MSEAVPLPNMPIVLLDGELGEFGLNLEILTSRVAIAATESNLSTLTPFVVYVCPGLIVVVSKMCKTYFSPCFVGKLAGAKINEMH